MINFADFNNKLMSTTCVKAVIVKQPINNCKYAKVLNYVVKNTSKPLSTQCKMQLQNTTNQDFIDQFLIDNGYTQDDLVTMYKTLFYEI